MKYLETLTDAQLLRLRCRVYARMERAFAGGLRFGIDLPTLRMCEPGWHAAWMALKAEFLRRRAAA